MNPVPTTATRSLLRASARARVSGRPQLVALAVALVVGILGMHALASHGTPSAPAAVASSTAATSGMGLAAMTGHESARADAVTAGVSHDAHRGAGSAPERDSDHDMTTMAMLCVAMLASAALTLLGLMFAGIRRPLLPAAFAPAEVRTRVLQWVRGTGPPPVWQFSVIRC